MTTQMLRFIFNDLKSNYVYLVLDSKFYDMKFKFL